MSERIAILFFPLSLKRPTGNGDCILGVPCALHPVYNHIDYLEDPTQHYWFDRLSFRLSGLGNSLPLSVSLLLPAFLKIGIYIRIIYSRRR